MGELVPSLLTAPCRKELLILAGDIESNPGPYTDYVGKDLCVVIMHIPPSSYLLTRNVNYLMWYVQYIFITNLMPKIIVNHNFAMPLLTFVTTVTWIRYGKM